MRPPMVPAAIPMGETEAPPRRISRVFLMCVCVCMCVPSVPCVFFKAWWSPAESTSPKRPDHGRSVHGEPKFTEDKEYYTQLQTHGAEHCTDAP